MSGRSLPFIGSRGPWGSGPKTASATCLLAPNPSAWTLDGTNTWFLQAPGSLSSIVVDPGPADPRHLAAIASFAHLADAAIATIVLTHRHPDHAEGARELHEMTGAPVRALDPGLCLGAEGLAAGDVLTAGDLEVRVIATPGHTSDSLCLHLPDEGSLLTGDTVLGRGTAVIAWPDGDLRAYLASLAAMREIAEVAQLLPGHGPLLDAPMQVIDAYLEHRSVRLDEVRDALASGCTTADDVVDAVYADVAAELRPAALMSVRAQLEYLGALPGD